MKAEVIKVDSANNESNFNLNSGFVSAIAAYILWGTTFLVSMHIKTPTAVFIGVFIANETLTSSVLFGAGLVMLGLWLSQKEKLWGLK